MKKTLIALATLAGIASAATDDGILFTSQVVSSTDNASTLTGIAFTLGETDRIDVKNPDGTATTLAAAPSQVELNSISIKVSTSSTKGWGGTLAMYVLDANKTLIAVSNSLDTSSVSTGSTQTFTFDDTASLIVRAGKSNVNNALTLNTQYYAYIANSSIFGDTTHAIALIGTGDTLKYIDTTQVSLALYKYSSDTSSSLENTVMNTYNAQTNSVALDGKYGAVVNIMTTPEPATATLSLLALAGLAVRRRRH